MSVVCARACVRSGTGSCGEPPSTLFTELCSWFVLTLRASVCWVLWARKMEHSSDGVFISLTVILSCFDVKMCNLYRVVFNKIKVT